MPYSLRPVSAEDKSFLYHLYASTRQAEVREWGWGEAEQEAFLQLQFRAQRTHYQTYPQAEDQLITVETHPIGRLFTSQTESELRLVDIALLPQWRGRGIESEVISKLLATAASADKKVLLHVEHNNPARRLYERLQFITINDTGIHYLMEWQPQDYQSADHSSHHPESETLNAS